jgi:hypothetical protein
MAEITQTRLSANSWCDDLAGAAFGKITVVYGHIDENWPLSVNGLLEKWQLRTKWSKTAFCP